MNSKQEKLIENYVRQKVKNMLKEKVQIKESYGQELDKLQRAFDKCVEAMRGSSVLENGPFGIWVDFGERNQFCNEQGQPLKRIK